MATTKAAQAREPAEEFDYDAYMEESVTVRLPLIPGAEKQEAQFVGVNGRSWVIPRGKDFQIPRYAAIVLQQSEDEQLNALRYQEEEQYRR
jgi:hypothetical protein